MTEYGKIVLIAQLALAILVLPSSAVCNCSCGDPVWSDFSSVEEARACIEYCRTPVAYDSMVTMNENTLAEIILNATDPDGDTITYHIYPGPSNGTLVIMTGNTVVYCPYENFTGVDRFSFRAGDGTRYSNAATVTITVEPECSSNQSHIFYGTVTIGGEPVPEGTRIVAVAPDVCSNYAGNPVTTGTDGQYGSADMSDQNLVVQGCIENGTPLKFYADGIPAEVCDVTTGGPWQTAYPFTSGGVTNLDLRLPPPVTLPDEVYIDALSLSISNTTYDFSTDLKLEGDPWMEVRVTSGMFTVHLAATGVHRFSFLPELRRNATLGIYEHGIPVSPEKNVWFGWDVVTYDYVATETRTFEILIFVDENPEIYDVKHITIHTIPPAAGHGIHQERPWIVSLVE